MHTNAGSSIMIRLGLPWATPCACPRPRDAHAGSRRQAGRRHGRRPPAPLARLRAGRCATCVETGLESFFFLSCSSVFDAGPH